MQPDEAAGSRTTDRKMAEAQVPLLNDLVNRLTILTMLRAVAPGSINTTYLRRPYNRSFPRDAYIMFSHD